MICQVFGHAEDLECSRGYNVNVPQRQADRMLSANGKVTHILHELIPGLSERVDQWLSERNISAP